MMNDSPQAQRSRCGLDDIRVGEQNFLGFRTAGLGSEVADGASGITTSAEDGAIAPVLMG